MATWRRWRATPRRTRRAARGAAGRAGAEPQGRRLSQQLFELAALQSTEQVLHRERFSLDEVVTDAVQKFELATCRPRSRCMALPPGRLELDGDLQLIERALTNLIDNALRHAPGSRPVRVSLRREGAQAEDRGGRRRPGPAGELHQRLDQGQSLRDPPIKRRSGGIGGLGLAIAQRVAALHGGSLRPLPAPQGGTRLAWRCRWRAPMRRPPLGNARLECCARRPETTVPMCRRIARPAVMLLSLLCWGLVGGAVVDARAAAAVPPAVGPGAPAAATAGKPDPAMLPLADFLALLDVPGPGRARHWRASTPAGAMATRRCCSNRSASCPTRSSSAT